MLSTQMTLKLVVHSKPPLVHLSHSSPVRIRQTEDRRPSLHPTITPSRFLLAFTLRQTHLQIFLIQQVMSEVQHEAVPLSEPSLWHTHTLSHLPTNTLTQSLTLTHIALTNSLTHPLILAHPLAHHIHILTLTHLFTLSHTHTHTHPWADLPNEPLVHGNEASLWRLQLGLFHLSVINEADSSNLTSPFCPVGVLPALKVFVPPDSDILGVLGSVVRLHSAVVLHDLLLELVLRLCAVTWGYSDALFCEMCLRSARSPVHPVWLTLVCVQQRRWNLFLFPGPFQRPSLRPSTLTSKV